MKINKDYINEYKEIIQTTNLQKGYQEFVKFFRYLRTCLEKEFDGYSFTGSIVENTMDYSYFQFTDDALKSKGLKIVVAFVHCGFSYEVWLSGMNRRVQSEYFEMLKGKPLQYTLTADPNRIDYILKKTIDGELDYEHLDILISGMKTSIMEFIRDIKDLI
jgi:hypothetical protein